MSKKELSKEGKRQVATALLLLKDWKCQGRFDIEITKLVFELAEHLGVKAELGEVMPVLPPMRIEPRVSNSGAPAGTEETT